jgi:hypothetical protein
MPARRSAPGHPPDPDCGGDAPSWTYGREAATGRHRQIAYGVLASDRQKMADSDNFERVTLAFFDDCERLLRGNNVFLTSR